MINNVEGANGELRRGEGGEERGGVEEKRGEELGGGEGRRGEEWKERHLLYFVREVTSGLIYLPSY